MEQEYVIGVANRYALFLDETSHEEDPFEIIKNAEAEKSKKKTLKTVSGESKENKGKPDPKAKPALASNRKGQGIKETQNVKPAETGALNKTKSQDGSLKTTKPAAGARKSNERPQERPAPGGGDKTVKFASNEPQPDRPNNRRNREDKPAGERNGDIARNRNFREGDRNTKGLDNDNGPRGPRNDADGPRGQRRDNERPFRGDRDRDNRDNRDNRDRPSGDNENRPPRRENRGDNRDNRDNRERRDFQERSEFPRETLENGEARPERRPGGSAIGRTKGARGPGGRNFDNRGKREFERKSGSDKTGVKAIDKREGAGAHNWGTHKDDLESVSNNLNSTTLSDDNADWADKTMENDAMVTEGKEGENVTDEPAAPVEEEPKELTLDEYRALRGKRELPQFNLRKAGEGEDLTQWKNMYEIKKKKETDEQDDEEEYDATEYPQRVGRQRHVLDIDITFSDSRRGPRGARGGRAPRPSGLNTAPGGGRNRQREGPRRGPREDRNEFGGGNREFRNRQSAPKVDDERDFPSLG